MQFLAKFLPLSSTTVVQKRALVTFIGKVKGVVLKNFLGGVAPKPPFFLTHKLTYS